jgi:putative lipoic acid-binding regulatory protein
MSEESAISYPLDFPIKIMGRREPRLVQNIVDIVHQRDLHHPRDVARATRRAVPGSVQSPVRGDGALSSVNGEW